MTIEIKQLVIRAVVEERRDSAPRDSAAPSPAATPASRRGGKPAGELGSRGGDLRVRTARSARAAKRERALALGRAMGITDLFKLAKLTIIGFSDEKRTSLVDTFQAQYNPETLSLQHQAVYTGTLAPGAVAAPHDFSYSAPRRLTVDLVLDGTKVGYMGVELLGGVKSVADQINNFLNVCYSIQSSTHQPNYLKLTWHDAVLNNGFPCRLESVDIRYGSFERDGSPLHATLSAVFMEQLAPPVDAARKNMQSPDVTHRRTVVAGDTLPLLCREIYGAADYYLRVAEANRLDDFRNLEVGRDIVFPPFDAGRKG